MYVYFIKGHLHFRGSARQMWKIGKAKDVARRLRQLQTGCPMDLSIFGTLCCAGAAQATDIERRLHRILEGKKQRGEWFILSSVDAIAVIKLIDAWPSESRIEDLWAECWSAGREQANLAYQTKTPVRALCHPEVQQALKLLN
jgi:hypothetical protein